MKRVTLKKVKEMAEKYGCEFYKGEGYFYFKPPLGKTFHSEGVYVYHLNSLTLEEWEKELLNKLKEDS